jgi:Zn-dependent M28 family amino/carboxypeptidase
VKDTPVTHRLLPILCAAVLVAVPAARPADPPAVISAERVKAHVAYLASDRLEGRGPGTRGEELATDYLADEFKKAGLKPAGADGTYLQPVPLVRIATDPKATLRATKGDAAIDFVCGDDFAGHGETEAALEAFDAEAVFVGHGITAPEFGWDDYKGADVKGKVVVLFTNEPPSDDPTFFGGKALTYYGRWTYKFEEAARRGAKACFIIHTAETAGYPYSVVRRLDGAQLTREQGRPALAFAGWLSRKAGEQLLALAGRTVDGALKEADTKGFKAYSLGVTLKGHFPTKVEKFASHNVVGMVEGSDPVLKSEAVIFTAHWDHLGVGRAVVGDTIYNGAADNATGCALLLELARAWSALSPRPKRSAIFLSVTAEEKGLLGSKYYAQRPAVPLGKTALGLNFDMILPMGVPESVVVNGAERTTAWPAVKAVAARHGLEIEPDPRAHLGTFYRSDHFSLARAGVPAFAVRTGTKIKGKTPDAVRQAVQEFNDKVYHSPQDEFRPEWDFSGFVVLGRFALDVGREVADADRLPTWNPGNEFRPAREKSGVK